MRIFSQSCEPVGWIGKEPVVEGPSDALLIRRSLHDPAAFAGIFDRHAATLLGYCTRRVGRDDAEDVLGETFRIAFETRGRFDTGRASALPWLYGIAAHLIMKRHRATARRLRAVDRLRVLSSDRSGVPFDETLADHDENARLLAAVRVVVDELAPVDREVLVLYAWEHLSYDAIAEAMDVPVGTVRSRLNRVRRRLRELRDDGGKEVVVPSDRAPGGVA